MSPTTRTAKATTPLTAVAVAMAVVLIGSRSARAEIPLVEYDDWHLYLDGRVNAFISVAVGDGLPDGEPNFPGAGTNDTKDAQGNLRSTRIRNGFMMSVLGLTAQKELSEDFNVTTRMGLWMNISRGQTKNGPGLVDPRELYAKVEGRWGSVLGGSNMALFGRGGILTDAKIAHEYGLGYPCSVEDASGGACGMTGFGAPFPGFEPGFVYATPSVRGVQLSLGVYDPATIGNGSLNRAPLPRLEAEAKFDFEESLRVFASGFWQVMEGTVNVQDAAGMNTRQDLHTVAKGAQAGAMATLGPAMLGGAVFVGTGFSPITYIDEHQTAVDSTGTLRDSRGGFGLGAVSIDAVHLKVAGGAGIFAVDKTDNDSGPITNGSATNPQVLKQNLGVTVGVYQTTAPLRFALEYFRAQHDWYEAGVASTTVPGSIIITHPRQVVHFINTGMSVLW